jgi:hypothetical protein
MCLHPNGEPIYDNMVMVVWIDSCEPAGNADLVMADIPEPQLIVSLGFLLREADEHISIAGNYKCPTYGKDDDTWDYVTTIPRCSIRAIHTMGDPRFATKVRNKKTQ